MRTIRFSIAALMAVVLALAIAFAALRNPSSMWSDIILLATRGVLGLACVGAICRRGAERAFWSGFAIFGWIYVTCSIEPYPYWPSIPTQLFLEALIRIMAIPIGDGRFARNAFASVPFLRIGHCLCALLFAGFGGFLARLLFGGSAAQPREIKAAPRSADDPATRRWWLRSSIVFLSGLAIVVMIAVLGAKLTPGLWSGLTFFMTCLLLGFATIGGLFGRAKSRESCLGALIFGAGFLMLAFTRPNDQTRPILPTFQLLADVDQWVPIVSTGSSEGTDNATAANARIRTALRKSVPLQFTEETTLDAVLKSIRKATAGPDGKVIPIYVDPLGLSESDNTMASTVQAGDYGGTPISAALTRCLAQLDLDYLVKDGLLIIGSRESIAYQRLSAPMDAFEVVGHCVLALVAAGIGGAVAPIVCDMARKRAG